MAGRASWLALLLPPAAAVAGPAHATVYMTVEAAQRQMFPAATGFAERSVDLSPQQRKAIARASGEHAPKTLQIWEAHQDSKRQGWFVLGRAIGKHDYITFAVALNPDGRIRSVEILEYRETYGGEIRNPRWRKQFVGKGPDAELKLDRDIKNISGATLSCQHVTQGIKALLAAVDLLFVNS